MIKDMNKETVGRSTLSMIFGWLYIYKNKGTRWLQYSFMA